MIRVVRSNKVGVIWSKYEGVGVREVFEGALEGMTMEGVSPVLILNVNLNPASPTSV